MIRWRSKHLMPHGFLIKTLLTFGIILRIQKHLNELKMSTYLVLTKSDLSGKKKKFIDEVKKLPDRRDNRGKRHSLPFLIITVVFALLSNRSKVSGIHRYMRNKIKWLRKVTGIKDARPVSRAHLPRMLARLSWSDLNVLVCECFGVQIMQSVENEWVAVDGKTLRGDA